MISNSSLEGFDVIEITNELPVNRLGGVGSVIDSLASGFASTGIKALWYLVDHNYSRAEVERILHEFPNVATGTIEELQNITAPIAHMHTYNHRPEILAYLKKKKTVFTIHSLLRCEAESNDIDLSWGIEQQERLIAGCDKIVVVSKAELDRYHALGYHTLNAKVDVIHNGLRPPRGNPSLAETKRLGFCGRLVPRKRPEYVQRILGEEGFEEYSCLIAGRGFSPYSRNLMSNPQLQQRVHYLGWCGQERLDAFYRAIELLVIPSSYEPFGMVALEAMSRGIPVVCSRIDGLVEVLGAYAIYADGCSYDAFRNAMKRWLRTDSPTRAAIANSAYLRYRDQFMDVTMAKRYSELFQR